MMGSSFSIYGERQTVIYGVKELLGMNQYGQRAQRHWVEFRPRAYAALEAPETFFTELGEEISGLVESGRRAMERQQAVQLASMQDLERMGRLNAIRSSIEELVMQEMVYAVVETLADRSEEELEALAAAVGGTIIEGQLRPADPEHPWRVMQTRLVEEFVVPEPWEQQVFAAQLMRWLEETPERSELDDQLEDRRLAM